MRFGPFNYEREVDALRKLFDVLLPPQGKVILVDYTHFSRLEFCSSMDSENRLFKANIYCVWQFTRIYTAKKKQSSATIHQEIK